MTPVIVVIVIVVVVLAIFAGMMIAAKNKFATQHETVQESWRQIDVELERRHTLIGNLVETVKASARFEQQTLTQIVSARSQAIATRGQGASMQSQAEQQLNGALNNFFQVSEAYPELQSNNSFQYLRSQMVECEDRIAAGRRFYNGNVKTYNSRFGTWPSSMMKGSYEKADYFQVDDPIVRQAPSLRGAFDDMNAPGYPPQQQGYPPQQGYQQQGFAPQEQLPPGQPQFPGQAQPGYGQQFPQGQPYQGQPFPQQGQQPQSQPFPQQGQPYQGQPFPQQGQQQFPQQGQQFPPQGQPPQQ